MSFSDADHLERLREVRDAIVNGLLDANYAEGVLTLIIRGRTKIVSDPYGDLEKLNRLILVLEEKVTDQTISRVRVASLNRVSRRHC